MYFLVKEQMQLVPQVFSAFYKIKQRAKKVVSDSLGLVDFAIGLVNSEVFWRIQITEELGNQSACQNVFGASWNDVWVSKC